jgi:hypothetical protein
MALLHCLHFWSQSTPFQTINYLEHRHTCVFVSSFQTAHAVQLCDCDGHKKQERHTPMRNTAEHLRNHCYSGKAINIKYYEHVSAALVIQHAENMSHIILSSVASLTLTIFFHTISWTLRLSEKKNISCLNIQCVFLFSVQIFSETFLILRRIQRDFIINYMWSTCYFNQILVKLEVLDRVSKNTLT